MIEHLLNSDKGCIIETGTAWDKDNWEGQGQSTLIWDWICGRTKHEAYSIDLNPEAAKHALDHTMNVELITGDSVKTLSSMADRILENCVLLYLDSYDWSPEANLDSAFHHMAELTCVWSKLPAGCMIVVDDRHGDMKGKHFMVELFMDKLGIKPVFKDYQIGWVKE